MLGNARFRSLLWLFILEVCWHAVHYSCASCPLQRTAAVPARRRRRQVSRLGGVPFRSTTGNGPDSRTGERRAIGVGVAVYALNRIGELGCPNSIDFA